MATCPTNALVDHEGKAYKVEPAKDDEEKNQCLNDEILVTSTNERYCFDKQQRKGSMVHIKCKGILSC